MAIELIREMTNELVGRSTGYAKYDFDKLEGYFLEALGLVLDDYGLDRLRLMDQYVWEGSGITVELGKVYHRPTGRKLFAAAAVRGSDVVKSETWTVPNAPVTEKGYLDQLQVIKDWVTRYVGADEIGEDVDEQGDVLGEAVQWREKTQPITGLKKFVSGDVRSMVTLSPGLGSGGKMKGWRLQFQNKIYQNFKIAVDDVAGAKKWSEKVMRGQKEDTELDESQKTYVVNVKKYFRGITDRGAVVKAGSEKEAIAKAAKQMKKKPNYLEIEGVYEDVEGASDSLEEMTKHIVLKFASSDDLWDAHDALRSVGMFLTRFAGGQRSGESKPASGWVDAKSKTISFGSPSVARKAVAILKSKEVAISKQYQEDVEEASDSLEEMTKLVLTKDPSGTWSFKGKVPYVLGYERKDGKPLTSKDIFQLRDLVMHSVPKSGKTWKPYKVRVFNSEEAAKAAAKKGKFRLGEDVLGEEKKYGLGTKMGFIKVGKVYGLEYNNAMYRIAPEKSWWRLDVKHGRFPWEAVTSTHYKSPNDAAKELARVIKDKDWKATVNRLQGDLHKMNPKMWSKSEHAEQARAMRDDLLECGCDGELDEAGFGKTFKPDADQIAALKKWRDKYGKGWKKKLMMAWQRASYGDFGDGSGYLQQVRNQGGPSWLSKYNLSEDVVDEGMGMVSMFGRVQDRTTAVSIMAGQGPRVVSTNAASKAVQLRDAVLGKKKKKQNEDEEWLDESRGKMVLPGQVKVGDYVKLGSYVLHVTKKPFVNKKSMSLGTMYDISGKVMSGPGGSKGTQQTLPVEFDSKVEVLSGFREDVEDVGLDESGDPRIQKAMKLGKKAFDAGKKAIPGHDKALMALMKGEKIGGAGAAIMKAWLRAWTKANLAAARSEDVELDEGSRPFSSVLRSLRVTIDDMETDPDYRAKKMVKIGPYVMNVQGAITELTPFKHVPRQVMMGLRVNKAAMEKQAKQGDGRIYARDFKALIIILKRQLKKLEDLPKQEDVELDEVLDLPGRDRVMKHLRGRTAELRKELLATPWIKKLGGGAVDFLLKMAMDPLYKGVFVARSDADRKKALKTLGSIRGPRAEMKALMAMKVAKGEVKQEDVELDEAKDHKGKKVVANGFRTKAPKGKEYTLTGKSRWVSAGIGNEYEMKDSGGKKIWLDGQGFQLKEDVGLNESGDWESFLRTSHKGIGQDKIDKVRAIEKRKPKSIYDKMPKQYRPFTWATPAPGGGGSLPMPWRVSRKDQAQAWLERAFSKIHSDLKIYVDTYGVDSWHGKEQLWVALRDNRDKDKYNAAIKEMAEQLKKMAKVRLVKPRRPGDPLSTFGLYLVDDLKRDVMKGRAVESVELDEAKWDRHRGPYERKQSVAADLMMKFPSDARIAIENKYWGPEKDLDEYTQRKLKEYYDQWSKYLPRVTLMGKHNAKLRKASAEAQKAEAAFKKTMQTAKVRDWNSLALKLQNAELALYNIKEDVSAVASLRDELLAN